MRTLAQLRTRLGQVLKGISKFARARKQWRNPSQAKIAILDGENAGVLVPLFGTEPYQTVYLRGEEFYLTPSTLFWTIRHFLKTGSLTAGYAVAVLTHIRPNIVVTFIDTNGAFQKTAQYYRGCRFLAIQNGSRILTRDNPPGSPMIFHSEFACLGRYEVDQYTKHGASVQRFYPIGSLKDSYYRARQPVPSLTKRFDLCLTSQIKPHLYTIFPEQMKSLEILSLHLKHFCETHGATLCIAARKHPDRGKDFFEWECNWFRERLGDIPQIFPNVRDEYTSYSLIDSSRVSLGMHTTVLREGFGRRNRILSCNFTGNRLYDFPVDGPWALSDPAYEVFERRLIWLLEMSDEEYGALCGDLPEYFIAYDAEMPTHIFLQKLIADAVRPDDEPSSVAKAYSSDELSGRVRTRRPHAFHVN